MVRALREGEQLPLPAEDLSADDDLLSWILVDQLGCLPNTKLGVHPQEVKFVGPPFKTSEVMSIVQENVVKSPDLRIAKRKLLDFHLIKAHHESKITDAQRQRFEQHITRYLMPILPTSRVEIFTTDRYTSVTGHVELAVYATRPLALGAVVDEVQGSIVPFPKAWSDEMDLVEDFQGAAVEEYDSDEEEAEEEEGQIDRPDSRSRRDESSTGLAENAPPSKGAKRKNEPKGARRSHRTKRRDFSVVWSDKENGYLLFLGPARFLNHDCEPNVKLYRKGKGFVTFTVIRPIRIGEEITTHYGEHYFGRDNAECLCLTCERQCKGGFSGKSIDAQLAQRAQSPNISASTRIGSPASARKTIKASALRNALGELNASTTSQADDSEAPVSIAGPSGTSHDDSLPVTPRKIRTHPSLLSIGGADSPATDATRSEPGSPTDSGPPKRERYQRKAARNAQNFSFLKRPKKLTHEPELFMDEDEEEYDRCATCAKALRAPIWYQNVRFDHCARCIRHALIFDLPWPAHDRKQVLEYPPSHLIPYGYVPPRVSSIPLPSLDKNRKRHVEPALGVATGGNHIERQACQLADALALEDLAVEQLREACWTAQETEMAALEAKAEKARLKKLKDDKLIKGSGVWQHYEYISEEEERRKELARHAMTSGTRRGGQYKANYDQEEERRLAKEITAQRLAAARARLEEEGEESDADDEGEGGQTERDPNADGASAEDVKPVTSPDKRIKVESPEIPKTNREKQPLRPGVMVIDLSGDTDSDDGNYFEYITTKLFKEAQGTGLQRNPDVGQADETDDPQGRVSGSNKGTAGRNKRLGKKTQEGSNGTGAAVSPVQNVSSSPIRRQAKTKPANRKKAPRPSRNGTAQDIGDAGVTTENEGRGRGRPKGTGKIQKAAARLASRTGSTTTAGPSEAPQQRISPLFDDQMDTQTRVETTLAAWAGAESKKDLEYEYLIEGLADEDGTTCMKSTHEIGLNPFDALDVINEYIVKERREYQTYLTDRDTLATGDVSSTPIKKDRRLPGQKRLLSNAEVKAWSPSRLNITTRMGMLSTDGFQLPKHQGGSTDIVGLVLDPGTRLGYGRPSMTEGPWLNGQYRLVAAKALSRGPVEAPVDVTFRRPPQSVNKTPIKEKPVPKQVHAQSGGQPNGVSHRVNTPTKSVADSTSKNKRVTPAKKTPRKSQPGANVSTGKVRPANGTPSSTANVSAKSSRPDYATANSTSMGARDDTGNSASTSLAEEEVERLVSGYPTQNQHQKRRLSIEDSPPRTKTKYIPA